ncbi:MULTISPECIES: precorrin-2 C(20)-methyltransferase [Geobacillus]|jgi:precorrin-2/cobalt-factor-2 C20-methyltransferase|uniref:Precorrin-2 methylase n=2 Tax=Geobacillus thermodenitrificans TaxID=33940 RepID=A4INZ8_GEOTN|nr:MULTISPECIES: precorrin-2 C(20)-methyltransferase [Geobacillus]AKM19091.1 Cobalt-precorrin-2 C(20)-methyltransferase [Geobacillus sp. 12AMOR1]ASS86049.1 precorrin-2 C(20)-methyltransferase [Geobacillus lituanicus]ATA60050.1 precorrin-2 [Geobacillus stearothermophilus]MED0653004.1 precorrin-2 C(20)-methyltransferase [Anoxybacillus geothermalis]STO12254.1 Cobalt-precorrin-2 C(20)-methyltransferase [[Flavobacterium] thermophilum]
MTGTLYGIGVGPGDPELMTVKAYRRLKEAEVIAYPKKGRQSKSYAEQIIDAYFAPEEKRRLGLHFPMTKDVAVLEPKWNEAADAIWAELSAGRDVAFVTEGDPLLYSTFIHLMHVMERRYPDAPIEVVPGVSSANAAAARLRLPLADGDEQVAIVPARDDYEAMKAAILAHDCVIFFKVAKVIDLMIRLLRELDLLHRAAVVTKVTSREEVIWDVERLEGAELEYLTLLVVRK